MKTLTTILLVLALVAPGAVFAGPNNDLAPSFWQSVIDWIGEALAEIASSADDAAEGDSEEEPPTLLDMGGYIDPAG